MSADRLQFDFSLGAGRAAIQPPREDQPMRILALADLSGRAAAGRIEGLAGRRPLLHQAEVRFLFGMDAMPNLEEIAAGLEKRAWKRLERPAKYEIRTADGDPAADCGSSTWLIVKDRNSAMDRGVRVLPWLASSTR